MGRFAIRGTVEEDAPNGGGDLGGTHSLDVDAEYMKDVPWWNPFDLRVKWEGFDATITDEEAHRIYKWEPDGAEAELSANGPGVSPVHTVREGTYLLRIGMKHPDDGSQQHAIEADVKVDYKPDF